MENCRPRAVFMAFGTKGDVLPIAAIAAAFACDLEHYHVVLITHSAHKYLDVHLAAKGVSCVLISTPPVLSVHQDHEHSSLGRISFSLQKKVVKRQHREECLSAMERVLGNGPGIEGDFIAINFFALEGWHLAELFQVRCVVAAPYVVPYSMPSSFERHFKKELPLLYRYLQEAPLNKVCWKDVIHWMWPLFIDDWGSWRSDYLNLSPCPLTDPVTGIPMWQDWPQSPLLLYGFSKEVVECPGYWPSNVHICGFWFFPMEWQFWCNKCRDISAMFSSGCLNMKDELCLDHADLQHFLERDSNACAPVFIGLSSVGSMGFLRNPQAFLSVLRAVLETTDYRLILFSAGYKPLDVAIQNISGVPSDSDQNKQIDSQEDGVFLFNNRLYCFSGTMPHSWLFPRCSVSVHHGGSGSTAAALRAGIPQVICPFMLDQFYWAERMFWLGVGPEPLLKTHLLPANDDDLSIMQAAAGLSKAIQAALSAEIKARALEIAERISSEDGVAEALKILKEEKICVTKDNGLKALNAR